MEQIDSMATNKSYIGSIFVRPKRSKNIVLSLSKRVAEVLDVPRYVSIGLPDSPANRIIAEEVLADVTDRYYKALGFPGYSAVDRQQALISAATIGACYKVFLDEYSVHRSEKSRIGYDLAYRAIMAHGDPGRLISDTVTRASRPTPYLEMVISSFIAKGVGINGKSVSARTLENYMIAFGVFVNWAHAEGYLTAPVALANLRRRLPPRPGKKIEIYTDLEIKTVIAWCMAEGQKLHYQRMGDILSILSRTSLRIHEVLEMKVSDIDTTTLTLGVLRKDGRTREYIPITPVEIEILEKAMNRNGCKMPDDLVFGYRRASSSRLVRTLHDVFRQAGVVRGKRGFHEFRKTFITRLCREVGRKLSLHEVSRLARCSIVVLERHYMKLSSLDLRDRVSHMWDTSL